MGAFKVLLWLAPVLAAIFFYIATIQQKHDASYERASAQFDLDFAKARSGDNKHFESVALKKENELKKLEEKEFFANEKSEKVFEELEKSLR